MLKALEIDKPMSSLDLLLEKTSRTFALAIPFLPEPTREEVTVAYLLFRIADTLEDAELWPKDKRIAALGTFSRLLEEPTTEQAELLSSAWREDPPSDNADYMELMAETPRVMDALATLTPAARKLIQVHVLRTASQMGEFVDRHDRGFLQLRDLPDLQKYCYAVAGIVGEMLTELFLLGRSQLDGVAKRLRANSVAFGEGLQLVNILKDSSDDAEHGRSYLPEGVDRKEVFTLARRDLEDAADYVSDLQKAGAPEGILAFTAVPVQLAFATLDMVEKAGPGSKITRSDVARIVERVMGLLAEKKPVFARG
jgi:farnesyl-diphosphate farnesyltransferase